MDRPLRARRDGVRAPRRTPSFRRRRPRAGPHAASRQRAGAAVALVPARPRPRAVRVGGRAARQDCGRAPVQCHGRGGGAGRDHDRLARPALAAAGEADRGRAPRDGAASSERDSDCRRRRNAGADSAEPPPAPPGPACRDGSRRGCARGARGCDPARRRLRRAACGREARTRPRAPAGRSTRRRGGGSASVRVRPAGRIVALDRATLAVSETSATPRTHVPSRSHAAPSWSPTIRSLRAGRRVPGAAGCSGAAGRLAPRGVARHGRGRRARGQVCVVGAGLRLDPCARVPFAPAGLGVDGEGRVYVANAGAGTVLRYRASQRGLVRAGRAVPVGPGAHGRCSCTEASSTSRFVAGSPSSIRSPGNRGQCVCR